VGRPKTGVNALQLVEGVEQLLRESWIGYFAGGHAFFTRRWDRLFGILD
jgi:hypothetical protein